MRDLFTEGVARGEVLNLVSTRCAPKNGGLIFRMGKVSELWLKIVVKNSHVFNLRNRHMSYHPGESTLHIAMMEKSYGFLRSDDSVYVSVVS